MIRTEGLTRRFGEKVAVENLHLTIEQGEVFGLLGPNGAGKTTTVRMLTGLIAPSGGRAWVAGHELGTENTAIRRAAGLLTEAPGFYNRLSAYRNLDFYARLYQLDGVLRRRRLQQYLERMGLWDRRNDPVGQFSKGMKQKLALARALIHGPKVLFLDEPTSGLDPEAAHMVRDLIEGLKEEGRTIVLCTHNLDEADRLCNRVAILKGRLLRVASPGDLRRQVFGRQVAISLREVTDEVWRAVCSLPFVLKYERDGHRLIYEVRDPEKENPAVVRAVVAAGGEVQYITEIGHSLEEAYLSLIQKGVQRLDEEHTYPDR
ncbi:MAG: ABC transporter ATP-binding protein [Firmicutes bacterium]|nr:ABC transporter ATP-binding protein [Bacillota bacterium]MCL5038752.1 ABC transporter ATP-binding protein [Bacillota bacterium]